VLPAPPGSSAIALATNVAEDALRQGAELFERRCLKPVHQRLDTIDETLARLRAGMAQAVRAARRHDDQVEATATISTPARVTTGAQVGNAGPLPTGPQHATVDPAHLERQTSLLELRRHLEDSASRAEAEARRCGQAEERCQIAERNLLHTEAEHEQALQRAQKAEARAEHEVRQREEAELRWQQRHAALQRQLRRTEVALGDATVDHGHQPAAYGVPSSSAEVDVGDRQTAGISGSAHPVIGTASATALVEDAQCEALGSAAILDLLRAVRGLERTTAAGSVTVNSSRRAPAAH